jgi:hypothetical protein
VFGVEEYCHDVCKGGFAAPLRIFASAILEPASIWGVTIRDDEPDSSYLALAASPEYDPVGTYVNSWGYPVAEH